MPRMECDTGVLLATIAYLKLAIKQTFRKVFFEKYLKYVLIYCILP